MEVIRNNELSLAPPEEIQTALGKQEVTDYKRIAIRRDGDEIQIHTYILTFNKVIIPREIKMVDYLKKVEQYILALLICFKYKKYGHLKESCRRHLTCGRCGKKTRPHGRRLSK